MQKNDYFERKIDAVLLSWAQESGRKPLQSLGIFMKNTKNCI
jgi:hypothetical protein